VRVFEDPRLRQAIADRGLPVSTAEELLAAEPEQRGGLIQRALDEHWDQARARDALHAPPPEPELEPTPARGHAMSSGEPAVSAVRPKGFTRAVRDFHRLLLGLKTEDLTGADRAALRALFRDLLLLARAPSVPGERHFPPLPSSPEPATGRGRTARGRRPGTPPGRRASRA
jgi:hypothetical protein